MTGVVDVEALARVLHGLRPIDPLDLEGCIVCRHSLQEAQRIVASGVVESRAQVQADTLEAVRLELTALQRISPWQIGWLRARAAEYRDGKP